MMLRILLHIHVNELTEEIKLKFNKIECQSERFSKYANPKVRGIRKPMSSAQKNRFFHFYVNRESQNEVCDLRNKPRVSGPQNK